MTAATPATANQATPPRAEIKSLTGVRFVAAAMVLISHSFDLWQVSFPSLGRFRSALTLGDIGVGVFFFLSGYILAYTYGADFAELTWPRWRAFLRRRVARIYPLQVATLLALVSVDVALRVAHHTSMSTEYVHAHYPELPFHLTLTHAWKPQPRLGDNLPWNPPSWSLSAEWLAYLLCPMLLWLFVRARRLLAMTAVVAVLLTVQFFTVYVAKVHIDALAIVGLFPLGALCWFAVTQGRLRFRHPDLVVCVVAVAVSLAFGPSSATKWRFAVIVAIGFLIVPIAQARGVVSRVLSHPVVVYLGRASFALYMTHDLVLRVLRRAMRHDPVLSLAAPGRVAALLATYAVVFAVAIATYTWIERPLERRLRRPWHLGRAPAAEDLRPGEGGEVIAHAEVGRAS